MMKSSTSKRGSAMTDDKLNQAIELADELMMWRKLSQRLPLDAPERWAMSVRFLKCRKEFEQVIREHATT